jgi:RIO-like serine/threonine protein kinase
MERFGGVNFMMILTKQQIEDAPGGAFGRYVKLSPSLGIKLIYTKHDYYGDNASKRLKGFRSIAKAIQSWAWREANIEADLLFAAQDSGVVPRCYGATVVMVGSRYHVGILMQHLGGKPLSEHENYDSVEVFDYLHDKLEELGIYHGDLHEDNIMVYRGKYYAVDFSPYCVNMEDK